MWVGFGTVEQCSLSPWIWRELKFFKHSCVFISSCSNTVNPFWQSWWPMLRGISLCRCMHWQWIITLLGNGKHRCPNQACISLQLLLLRGCHCSPQVLALGWAFVLEPDMERVFSNAFYQWSSWKLEYSCRVVAGRSLKQSWARVLHPMVSLGLLSCCFSSSSTKLADSWIFKRKKVKSILLKAFSTQVLDA